MIYYISLLFIDQFSYLNIFKYLTFRASGAFITSILISFLVGPKLIEYFKNYRKRGCYFVKRFQLYKFKRNYQEDYK